MTMKYRQFYRENQISRREKIAKTDFAPSEKYSSYAAVNDLYIETRFPLIFFYFIRCFIVRGVEMDRFQMKRPWFSLTRLL